MARKRHQITKGEMAARQMPPLRHSIDGEAFDIMKSEVVQWLVQQPEVVNWLFDKLNTRKAIIFRDGRWIGCDYEA